MYWAKDTTTQNYETMVINITRPTLSATSMSNLDVIHVAFSRKRIKSLKIQHTKSLVKYE